MAATAAVAVIASGDMEDLYPETEIIYEHGPTLLQRYQTCSKNPGHLKFVSAADFSKDDLPEEIRTDDVMKVTKGYMDRTVKVTVSAISPYRNESPDPGSKQKTDERGKVRKCTVGTGVISRRWQFRPGSAPFEYVEGQPCPCCKTQDTPKMNYVIVIVTTATHVILDEIEAKAAEFVLFDDSEENENRAKRLYGVGLSYDHLESSEKVARTHTDRVRVKCVSHDPELIQILKDMEPRMDCGNYSDFKDWGVIVSHPHGRSKCVTIGNILSRNFPRPRKERSHQTPPPLPRYTFGPPTKCRMLSPNLNNDNSTYQQFEMLVGGKRGFPTGQEVQEIILEGGVTVSIPLDASYLCRHDSLREGWISFPPGTQFSSNGGANWYVLPGLEIHLATGDTDLPVQLFQTGFLTYDIATCPGSSGAPVLFSERGSYCVYHSGATSSGANRSSIVHFCS